MQKKSALFDSILRSQAYTVTYKAVIDGAEYTDHSGLIEAKVYGGLFNGGKPSVGGCVCRELDLTVMTQVVFSRMAEIRLYCRVEVREQVSEWLPKGVFFIDTRQQDSESGIVTIHGYDAVLKSERPFLAEGDPGEWPRAASAVVNEICRRMGVELDERSELDDRIQVPYPNDWTGREILSMLAIAHCGNWTITDTGRLRLVPFRVEVQTPEEETYYLVDEYGNAITFGGVRILV